MQNINVIKRDGRREPLDISKFQKVTNWACEGLTGVSTSELELKSQIQFFDGMRTSDIQETLIKAAADLIDEDSPNYQFVAGRLIQYDLYKKVFGGPQPMHILDVLKRGVADGYYEPALLLWYSEEEWDSINDHIDHTRDSDITYAGMDLFRSKYLIRNRSTKQIYETPQIAFALIAATFFHRYNTDRLKWVKDFYDSVSTFEISLPTPIMAGLRSPQKQFSSCVLIETADSLKSIFATTTAIGLYVANRAGIGIGAGALRGAGSVIRKGDSTHTGVTSFYKLFQAAVSSCNQGSLRKGSGNLNWVGWHQEFRDLIVLKNNKGTEDNRIRQLDYTVQLSKLFYERLITGGDITFFSPSEVPGLYDAFFEDENKFKELYEKYERSAKIRKTSMPAIEFFTSIIQERKDTGRIYILNVDHANSHGAFKSDVAPIRMTNLCVEVTLPTKPIDDINSRDGEIALCTLAAINMGKVKSKEDMLRASRLLVRALDELLTYQDYPVEAGRIGATSRRPLGIGIIGLAHWLAKNDYNYQDISPEGLDELDTWAQMWSYSLIKASVELAQEMGPCALNDETKYSDGILPIDTRKLDVDELVPHVEKMPWEELRQDLRKYGIRNSTLMALMPAETSALISNATNGIEPPRALVSVKGNKDQLVKQVVPEIRKLKNKYDLAWDQRSPRGYLKIAAVLQKCVDQSISVNTTYNPTFYEDEQIPMSELIGDVLFGYKYGIKSFYYNNTADLAGEINIENSEEDCESCRL